jgi:hypothetical protein
MIGKFAQYRGIGGGRVSPARAAASNDNHVLRRVFSDPRRMPKCVLTCHWLVRPQTGALECVWETQAFERAADAVIDEDQIRRPRMPFRLLPIAEPREDGHVDAWKSRSSGRGAVVPSRRRTADRRWSDEVFA